MSFEYDSIWKYFKRPSIVASSSSGLGYFRNLICTVQLNI